MVMFAGEWRRIARNLESAIAKSDTGAVLVVPGDGFPKIKAVNADRDLDRLEAWMTKGCYMLPWISNRNVVMVVLSYNVVAAWRLLKASMAEVAAFDRPEGGYEELLAETLNGMKASIEHDLGIKLPED